MDAVLGMDPVNVPVYRKLIAAICGLTATWLTTSIADGGIDTIEAVGLVAGVLGSVAVWLVPNEPPPAP